MERDSCWEKEERRGVHVEGEAAQAKSRVWVIRTRDLEAWKKEFEFCKHLVS